MTNSFKTLHMKQQLDLLRKNQPKDEAFYNEVEKATNDQLENYKESRKLKFIKSNWQFLKGNSKPGQDASEALNKSVVLERKQGSSNMIFKQKSHLLEIKPLGKELFSIEDKLKYYREKAETLGTEEDSVEGSKSFMDTSNSRRLNTTNNAAFKYTNIGYFPKVKSRKLADAKSITAALLDRKGVSSVASNLKIKDASQISSSFFGDMKSSSYIRTASKEKLNENTKKSQGNLHNNETNYLPDRCDTFETIDKMAEFDRPDLRVNTEGSSFVPVMVYNLDKPVHPVKKEALDPNISEIIKSSFNAAQLKAHNHDNRSRRSTSTQASEVNNMFRVTNIKFYEPATVEKSKFPLTLIENLPEHRALFGFLKMSKQIHVPYTQEMASFLNKEILGQQKHEHEDLAQEYGVALLKETYRDYLRQKSPSKYGEAKHESLHDGSPVSLTKIENRKQSSHSYLKGSQELFREIRRGHYDEEKTAEIYNNRRKNRPHGLGRKYLNASFGVGRNYNDRSDVEKKTENTEKDEPGKTKTKIECNVNLLTALKKRSLKEYKGS